MLIHFSYAQIIGQKCLPEWWKSKLSDRLCPEVVGQDHRLSYSTCFRSTLSGGRGVVSVEPAPSSVVLGNIDHYSLRRWNTASRHSHAHKAAPPADSNNPQSICPARLNPVAAAFHPTRPATTRLAATRGAPATR